MPTPTMSLPTPRSPLSPLFSPNGRSPKLGQRRFSKSLSAPLNYDSPAACDDECESSPEAWRPAASKSLPTWLSPGGTVATTGNDEAIVAAPAPRRTRRHGGASILLVLFSLLVSAGLIYPAWRAASAGAAMPGPRAPSATIASSGSSQLLLPCGAGCRWSWSRLAAGLAPCGPRTACRWRVAWPLGTKWCAPAARK